MTASGQLESGLPPGYPSFSGAPTAACWDRMGVVVWVQLGLSLATALLVFKAVAESSPLGAVIASMMVALHPLFSQLTWYIMSETLGAFLCSLLVICIVREERGKSDRLTALAAGLTSGALVLTSPYAAILAGACCLALAWMVRRSPSKLLALLCGCGP